MEKQTLKKMIKKELKNVPKEQAKEILNNTYKSLTEISSKAYDSTNTL